MLHLRRLLQPFSSVTTQGRPCTRSADTMSQVKVISYEDLKKVTGKVPIFDVRSPEEVSNGKIPSSVNIPVDEIDQALKMDPEDFKKKYAVNKPTPGDNLIVHCQMGRRGARAAEIAMAQGYENSGLLLDPEVLGLERVQNYVGGYKEWSEKGGK